MIAPAKAAPQPRQVERVRRATKRRVRRTRVRIHRPVFAVLALTVLVLVPLLAYVKLTSDLTSLTYALAETEQKRTALLDDSQRLEETIAKLKSPERLAQLATQLKMHDPHVYAVVQLPLPKVQPKPTGIAFFGWITHREH
jgi:cell division protein FtsL